MITIRLNEGHEYLATVERRRKLNTNALILSIIQEPFEITDLLTGDIPLFLNTNDLLVGLHLPFNCSGWTNTVLADIKEWLSTKYINAHYDDYGLSIHNRRVIYRYEVITNNYTNSTLYIAFPGRKVKSILSAGLYDYGITHKEIMDIIEKATENFLKSRGVE